MKPSPIFVLYHAHCADGFGAATAAWMRIGDHASYLPVTYGEPLPEIPDGAEVYILDFSYPREVLIALAERCSVLVLDHHATAEAALADLPFAVFDKTKSGAVLAWERFHGEPVPPLIHYVQDRDLWKWELPESREASAGIALLDRNCAIWAEIIRLGNAALDGLKHDGRAALRQQIQLVHAACDRAHFGPICGRRVPIVNSAVFQSEIGHELLARHAEAPFAAIYFDRTDEQRVWSLRSRADFDVSQVARAFGGGGHRQAAGFEETIEPAENILAHTRLFQVRA